MKSVHHYKADIRWSDDDDAFVARAPELDGVITHGKTLAEAARMLDEAIHLHLRSLEEDQQPIPEPVALQNLNGKYPLRMPKELHQDVVIAATQAGKSVNEYIVDKLSESDEKDWSYVKSARRGYSTRKAAVKSSKKRLAPSTRRKSI